MTENYYGYIDYLHDEKEDTFKINFIFQKDVKIQYISTKITYFLNNFLCFWEESKM